MEKINIDPVAVGSWGDNFTWEIHASQDMPPAHLITAVACIALFGEDDSVVLTRNQRGWEILAGHIEPGESPLEALAREAQEEGGYTVSSVVPFGYRKITANNKPAVGSREASYPYPTSYIAYFLVSTDLPIGSFSGEEILESRTFSFAELEELQHTGELSEMELTIIKLGLNKLASDSTE